MNVTRATFVDVLVGCPTVGCGDGMTVRVAAYPARELTSDDYYAVRPVTCDECHATHDTETLESLLTPTTVGTALADRAASIHGEPGDQY